MAATGNVRYSQIRSGDRTGNGSRLVTAASGTLSQNVPLLYDANGNVVATATRSGNTTEFATIDGTKTAGKMLTFDADGNIEASTYDVGAIGAGGGGVFGWLGDFTPPDLTDFAWVNQGSATATQAGTNLYMTAPLSGTNSLRILKRATPATPWVITIGFLYSMHQTDFAEAGLVYRQSSDGKLVTLNCQFGTSAFRVTTSKWTNPTTFSAVYTPSPQAYLSPSSVAWLRIADDATNRISSWSLDGDVWEALHTVGRTDFLTADEWGIYLNNANSQVNRASFFHLDIS